MATPDNTAPEEREYDSNIAAEVDIPEDDDDDDLGEPDKVEVRAPGEPQRQSRKEARKERYQQRLARDVQRSVDEHMSRMRPQQAQPVYAPQPQRQESDPDASELSEIQEDLSFTLTRLSDPNTTDAEHKKLMDRYSRLEQKKMGLLVKKATPRQTQAPQSSPHVEQLRYEFRDVLKGNSAAEERAATMARVKLAADSTLGLYGAVRESLEEMRVAAKAASARPSAGGASRYGNSSSTAGSTAGSPGRTTFKMSKAQVGQARSVYPNLSEEKAIAKWASSQLKLEKAGKI